MCRDWHTGCFAAASTCERRKTVAENGIPNTNEIRVYNMDEKEFNYKLARSADLPFNISTHMPVKSSTILA